jgi:hypothetical protein
MKLNLLWIYWMGHFGRTLSLDKRQCAQEAEADMDPNQPLTTKDLAHQRPRPMDETLAGYAWLPRIIDKARAANAGTLGGYVHPCPVDRRCLGLLGVEAERFREIASSARTGAEVVAGLRRAGARSAADAWFDAVAFEEALMRGDVAHSA